MNFSDLDDPVSYDLDRMQESINSGTIRVPMGLAREQRRAYLTLQAEQRELGAEYENTLLNNLDSLYEEQEGIYTKEDLEAWLK